MKGLRGQDGTDESIWIVEFASGEDGSLAIKQIEQFVNTNTYLDIFNPMKASK